MPSNKEISKKMLVKQTINSMNKQLQKLEEQKQVYIDAARVAKEKDLPTQYELAMNGLKMTMIQERRVYEMKLNFEITAQLRDMSDMTAEFLKGMEAISKDMFKLSFDKEFFKVGRQFSKAVQENDKQSKVFEDMMKNAQVSFESGSSAISEDEEKELDKLVMAELEKGTAKAAQQSVTTQNSSMGADIERELEALKKQI